MTKFMNNRRDVLRLMGTGSAVMLAGFPVAPAFAAASARATVVDVVGDAFHINGKPTYPGRAYRGSRIEGLLFTSRMVNCIANDQNPETRGMWAYRDGPWDPERNTNEFIAALPLYRARGLTSVAFNIQGGSPMGYGWHQPWQMSGYTADGHLLPDYRDRLIRVLDALDAAGMVAILGLFYIAAKPALKDEAAVMRAADEVIDLICQKGYTHVLIEVGNEVDLAPWAYDIIKPARAHELVARIQARSKGKIRNRQGRLQVSTSILWHSQIPARLLESVDYVLFHGNAMATPDALRSRAKDIRAMPGYHGQPLLINEDDHFDFEKFDNDLNAAVQEYVGWGYFDYRQITEPFEDGYQSLPVDWGIHSARKKGFFNALAEITGATPG
ncbi:hypothetical protein [Novosphingobium rosa]|uniref:hypothetical protein n=1 Tax=Novosphingobium rosa TaxID=76978 RepID=UPI000830E969|nr:hypothetical protein [Novosphingobium rosa]